ncbi:MAG: DUF4296 domain-containing protein [Lepagella sp.]
MAFRKFFLLCCLALIVSCVKRPDGVLSDSEMIPVLADIQIAEAYVRTTSLSANDPRSELLVNYVLDNHGVSRAEFDSTMAWYGRNTDKYYDVCEKVEMRIAKRRDKFDGLAPASDDSSNDIWPYPRFALVSPNSGSNAIEFSIPTSGVKPGERLQLKMRTNELFFGTAILGVEYENGLKSYVFHNYNSVKRFKLSFQTDSTRRVSRVFGNFAFTDEARIPQWLDSISLTILPFDTLEYQTINGQRFARTPVRRRPIRHDSISSSPATNPLPGSVTSRPYPSHPSGFIPGNVSKKSIIID